MPIQSSPLRTVTRLSPLSDSVLAGQFGANLVELVLPMEGVRRDEAAVGTGSERLTVDLDRREHGHDRVVANVDGARTVGDGRDDLEPRPQSASA